MINMSDIELIENPLCWVHHPFLPMLKKADNKDGGRIKGTLIDAPEYVNHVFLLSWMELMAMLGEGDSMKIRVTSEVYPNGCEDMLRDGWYVD